MKKLICAVTAALSLAALSALDFPYFSGFAGIMGNFSNDIETTKFAPELNGKMFFAGQFDFNGRFFIRSEISVNTEDIIETGIFENTGAQFKINELSFTFHQSAITTSHFVSLFMGNYEPIGSDVFLQRQFGISEISSFTTETWNGLCSSKLYPFYGIGGSYVMHFEQPVATGLYLYENEDKRILVIREADTVSETQTTKYITDIKVTHTAVTSTSVYKTAAEYVSTTPEILYIDINSADLQEFMKLPEIGEKTAQKIIDYRFEYGEFRNIEEIMNVDGIGEAIFEKVKNMIYVAYPVYNDENEEEYEEVPQEEETEEAEVTLDDIAPIDLNTADIGELMLLPHVDENVAIKIISLREEIGGFSNVRELVFIDELTQNEVSDILEFVMIGQLQ